GRVRWSHPYRVEEGSGGSGVLSTAGKLVFSGDPADNLIAFEAATGKILWHAGLTSSVSNGPITYELDGRQYLIVAGGPMVYAFTLPE
ncbi:MAG TPA: PQQ-binding-like beta-propeller repeat protein, partial [Bryobacteraceae bacterium]|nr:PQQ-binding-like beta-propeller repeat protein [Bryobacteraceae bacterium]